ncbi:unnamed protein product [Peniophora sp. CBMAI 1063]|nr:unnamed protein product [Peniophora sp. CBMAI 1063]
MVEPVIPLVAVSVICNLASKAMQRAKERSAAKQEVLAEVSRILNEMTTLSQQLQQEDGLQQEDVARVQAAIRRTRICRAEIKRWVCPLQKAYMKREEAGDNFYLVRVISERVWDANRVPNANVPFSEAANNASETTLAPQPKVKQVPVASVRGYREARVKHVITRSPDGTLVEENELHADYDEGDAVEVQGARNGTLPCIRIMPDAITPKAKCLEPMPARDSEPVPAYIPDLKSDSGDAMRNFMSMTGAAHDLARQSLDGGGEVKVEASMFGTTGSVAVRTGLDQMGQDATVPSRLNVYLKTRRTNDAETALEVVGDGLELAAELLRAV